MFLYVNIELFNKLPLKKWLALSYYKKKKTAKMSLCLQKDSLEYEIIDEEMIWTEWVSRTESSNCLLMITFVF